MQTITIKPWPDPVIDTLGHDPRSTYVERFWLPTLGPTAILVLRRLADRLDESPDGFTLAVAGTSRELGLGEREGASSPLLRTLTRLVQFGLACEVDGAICVRRHVPPVSRKHVSRLPEPLRVAHQRFTDALLDEPVRQRARARARRTAFVLLETGDEPDTAVRALERIGYHPDIAAEATRWAVSRHRAARMLAEEPTPAA
jgi:hypothetical protein